LFQYNISKSVTITEEAMPSNNKDIEYISIEGLPPKRNVSDKDCTNAFPPCK
jgi:hypothetical protein